ncbi:unnamed protein product, partial [Rotaria sp. Silwood2]
MVGIDARNKSILDTKYICPTCSLILQNPIQLPDCGHRFCETCLNTEQKMTIKCPQCQAEILRSDIIRAKIEDHYLTRQHQHAILTVVRQLLAQLNDRQIDIDLPRTTTAGAGNSITVQLEELYEMLNILVDGIETLTNDQQGLTNESLQTQMTLPVLAEELSKVKFSIEESNAFLEGFKHNQNILNQDLSSLQEKINDLQFVSYDGILVWKITNFQEKMIDAQSERQTSIYSPPFYSSPNGYKMRARLYLNVSFCVYDQTPAQRHIIDSFRPDVKSSSFQRPRSDMNIASGIPKFIPLEAIQQEGNPYVRDDTMFIKIMVDFEEIPKTLLPYALSLNPGLPTHIQQAMIKEEAKRRIQLRSNDQLQIPQ